MLGGELHYKDATAPLKFQDGHLHLHILVDRSSVEIFVNDGHPSMTTWVMQTSSTDPIIVFAEGGTAEMVVLDLFKLKSCWEGWND
jgi:sucrose-6-phosphate hydrolase SacC (GH32 family)